MFKWHYLCDGKLSWSDHDAHIKTMVKFIKNNQSWMTEQFYDCLCYAVRCMDFSQQWKNEFQEMPWFYYDMEHLVGARDVLYEFYSAVKYDINERLKDSLIDVIACIEWFGENLKNSPRNGQYKDFHEYDDFVLKRNPKYIQYLHCMFIRKAKQEEERLIRKAEENRKPVHRSDALLKPVNSDEKAKRHYNDFGEYLDDHPEIVKMADKYPTMFQERVYEYRMPLKEKLLWFALYTVGIVSAWFVGSEIGNLIKGMP